MVLFWFLLLLTVIVFVHELGHYLVARLNGVRVDVFSIGYGIELFGYSDKFGTRWKFSLIPLGGYVKFFGDINVASTPAQNLNKNISGEEFSLAFQNKTNDIRINPTFINSKKFSNSILNLKIQSPNFFDAKRIHFIIRKIFASSKAYK